MSIGKKADVQDKCAYYSAEAISFRSHSYRLHASKEGRSFSGRVLYKHRRASFGRSSTEPWKFKNLISMMCGLNEITHDAS